MASHGLWNNLYINITAGNISSPIDFFAKKSVPFHGSVGGLVDLYGWDLENTWEIDGIGKRSRFLFGALCNFFRGLVSLLFWGSVRHDILFVFTFSHFRFALSFGTQNFQMALGRISFGFLKLVGWAGEIWSTSKTFSRYVRGEISPFKCLKPPFFETFKFCEYKNFLQFILH